MIASQRPSFPAPIRTIVSWVVQALSFLTTKALVFLVRFYCLVLSPMFRSSCRFLPTCSQYALEALQKHPPSKALSLTVARVLRCRPWGSSGHDPVPD